MKKILISTLLIAIYTLIFYLGCQNFNNNNELILSIIGTVLGGLLLSLIYFILYEFFYRIPDLSGKWEFEETTIITSYNPYKNMKVKYLIILWNEGQNIFGSGERISEINQNESFKYKPENRININIQGHIRKRYFWNDEIIIHYFEEGRKRKSSTIHKLELKSKSNIKGTFFKTAANASGNSTWDKKEYDKN